MMKKTIPFVCMLIAFTSQAQNINVNFLGRYTDGREVACEISTYDKLSKKLFVTNAAVDSIDIVDISDVTTPVHLGNIDVLTYGGGVNSVVSLNNGYIAAAIEANTKQNNGFVVFYDTAGNYINKVTVGALPDMIALSHDGNTLVVANEGEPSDDYLTDPDGSVSFIDISNGVANLTQNDVTTVDFSGAPSTISGSLNKPGVSWQKDLEPEYVAISEDDSLAFVICQEANVLVTFNMTTMTIVSYKGLGFKDHSVQGNHLDASNKDQGIHIQSWNVMGVYMPDAIASYTVEGNKYVVSANEGDGRDYAGYSSEARIGDLMLDTVVFPNYAFLQADSNLGRLKTLTDDVIGDTDNDGYVEELYCYGARSFSIWDESGNLVYDSGDDFEKYIESNYADFFNCSDGLASEMDDRSDDKGPEPEAIVIGKIREKYFAFIGLERQGGIMVYDVTDPANPVFETFINSYDEVNGTMIDIAPEGLLFIPASESHNDKNLLIVSNEFSGTTAIYEVEDLFSGIEIKSENKFEVKAYPNPSNGLLQLSKTNAEPVQYVMSNILGNVVKTGVIEQEQTTLDLSKITSGVYFITFHSLGNNSIKNSIRVILN